MNGLNFFKRASQIAWLSIPATIVIAFIGLATSEPQSDPSGLGIIMLLVGSFYLALYLIIIEGIIALILTIIYYVLKRKANEPKKIEENKDSHCNTFIF